jgi:hypothetical protein
MHSEQLTVRLQQLKAMSSGVAFVLLTASLLCSCKHSQGSVRTESKQPELTIEKIELQRRNWESNGTDRTITKDGSYSLVGVVLGQRKEVLKKELTPSRLNDLHERILAADILSYKDAYGEPPPDTWNWWGIELTITTNQWSKTLRFHSEDDAVPDELKNIVQQIMFVAD